MKSENLEMLKSLIKVKKLHLSEMEKKNADYTNSDLISMRQNIMAINSMEVGFLEVIVKHEEKDNGNH